MTDAASLRRLDIVVDEYSISSIQVIDKSIWTAVKDAKPDFELRLKCRVSERERMKYTEQWNERTAEMRRSFKERKQLSLELCSIVQIL